MDESDSGAKYKDKDEDEDHHSTLVPAMNFKIHKKLEHLKRIISETPASTLLMLTFELK